MEIETNEDITDTSVLPSDTNDTLTQDPIKEELERVHKKSRTQTEKLLYTKKRIESQLKELGITDEEPEIDDDKPLTIAMWKKLQAETATKTAIELAEEVENEDEKELIKFHIENTIKSSGDPQKDLSLAKTLVNAVKNKQILEEVTRKPEAKKFSTSSGVPAKNDKIVEFTQEELLYMRPPFNLTKEEILKARK